jgi:hypothetical protein
LPFRRVVNYIAFSRGTPDEEVNAWQQTLDEIKTDGTYERLEEKALQDWQEMFMNTEVQMN